MTSAHDFGRLAFFRGKERNPSLDKSFCKAHLDGKDNEYQRKALLEWLEGYDEEIHTREDG